MYTRRRLLVESDMRRDRSSWKLESSLQSVVCLYIICMLQRLLWLLIYLTSALVQITLIAGDVTIVSLLCRYAKRDVVSDRHKYLEITDEIHKDHHSLISEL